LARISHPPQLQFRIRALKLQFNSDYTDRNRPALTLRVFPPRLLCLLLRFEWLGQRGEHTTDAMEKQPLLNDFGHFKFI
jgi:hypothetical protein